jgi:hypothetical protein
LRVGAKSYALRRTAAGWLRGLRPVVVLWVKAGELDTWQMPMAERRLEGIRARVVLARPYKSAGGE